MLFVINSLLLGVGLTMDAFAVSTANAFADPKMHRSKQVTIALTFALFQMVMPLIGWFCVHTIRGYFAAFAAWIPWIALILLCYIGGTMLFEGRQKNRGDENAEEASPQNLTTGALILQGIATSIDALSVGFAISQYNVLQAFVCSLLIAIVTFGFCFAGVSIGKKAGTYLSGWALTLGGLVLIGIGIEIFVTGVFF